MNCGQSKVKDIGVRSALDEMLEKLASLLDKKLEPSHSSINFINNLTT